jgi:hypothetical protein
MRFLSLIATLPNPSVVLPGDPQDAKSEEQGVFSVQYEKTEKHLIAEGMWWDGKYVAIDVAKKISSRAMTQQMIEEEAQHRALGPTKGAALYRVVDKQEWQRILADGYYTIPSETAFGETAPTEAPDEGAIIRIAEPGPFYSVSPTGRVTSRFPHYADVNVFDDNRWITLDGYRVRHHVP